MNTQAYIGLGSNLSDPPEQLTRAVRDLDELPATHVLRVSSFYRNPALGPPQPDYVNAVVAVHTDLSARALLAGLHSIERAHGRVRDHQRWGPRTLDLDLLTYADLSIEEDDLVVPHPGLAARAFVLVPLHEIAPELVIPGHPRLVDLLAAVDRSALVRMCATGA
jgi:2-amino-4-hydroxy-6-hydroxymethyldihydropteridine diphosphokinase